MRGLRESVREARKQGKGQAQGLKGVATDALVLRGRCGVYGRLLYKGVGLDRLRMAGLVRAEWRPYPYIPLGRNEALELYPQGEGLKELGGSPESEDCFEFTFSVRIGHA